MPKTLPTSFKAARAESVPNVTICATDFSPYLPLTYSMTFSRLLSAKSISISGIETRAGFRKRSNSRSYCSGSTFVMPSAYATMLPAALPRPGPTGTPRRFAASIKSCTIRKYPAYPMVRITSISWFSRCSISGVMEGYRLAIPSRASFSKY